MPCEELYDEVRHIVAEEDERPLAEEYGLHVGDDFAFEIVACEFDVSWVGGFVGEMERDALFEELRAESGMDNLSCLEHLVGDDGIDMV